jgi:hypothetical protein
MCLRCRIVRERLLLGHQLPRGNQRSQLRQRRRRLSGLFGTNLLGGCLRRLYRHELFQRMLFGVNLHHRIAYGVWKRRRGLCHLRSLARGQLLDLGRMPLWR